MSADSNEHHIHPPSYYVKIYGILLVLLIVSIIGPELGNRAVTLFTAFGIAIIKALMVAAYFMHLNIEKKYIWYMLYTMLLFLLLFFSGVASDVMRTKGDTWINSSAVQLIEEHKNNAGKPDHH